MSLFFSTLFSKIFGSATIPDYVEQYDNYPLDDSLRDLIPDKDSPLTLIRLVRDISADLSISQTEVEILFLLASDDNSIPLGGVIQEIDHITPERVKRLLKKLHKAGLVYSLILKYDEPLYGLTPKACAIIKSYHKD